MAEELRELRALVERAGGRRAVLLVAEVAEGAPAGATLAAFARELLGEEAPGPPGAGGSPPPPPRRRRALSARLLLVLWRGGAARGGGARARLREVVRDVRGRLAPAPPPAVVGVLLPGGDGGDAAALDETLRRHFPAPGTVRGARYSPGSAAALRECREAACRALRAALQLPAERKESERWRLPSFLQCIYRGRRSRRKGPIAEAANVHKDDVRDLEEEVALTSLSPNGNYEEAAGDKGT
ncbi:uncharacterized protein C2orf72 homolog [Eudromia elegans]